MQYVERYARAAAIVASSKRRRSMWPRTALLSVFHASATSGRNANAGA
jgi:hypothetical protein